MMSASGEPKTWSPGVRDRTSVSGCSTGRSAGKGFVSAFPTYTIARAITMPDTRIARGVEKGMRKRESSIGSYTSPSFSHTPTLLRRGRVLVLGFPHGHYLRHPERYAGERGVPRWHYRALFPRGDFTAHYFSCCQRCDRGAFWRRIVSSHPRSNRGCWCVYRTYVFCRA